MSIYYRKYMRKTVFVVSKIILVPSEYVLQVSGEYF